MSSTVMGVVETAVVSRDSWYTISMRWWTLSAQGKAMLLRIWRGAMSSWALNRVEWVDLTASENAPEEIVLGTMYATALGFTRSPSRAPFGARAAAAR